MRPAAVASSRILFTPNWSVDLDWTGKIRRLTLVVHGTPGPQGSKSFKGMTKPKDGSKGKAIMAESSKKVAPWREAVERAAKRVVELPEWQTWDCPLIGSIVFTLRKPQRPKAPVPDRYPDASKLLRSTEDALTKAGIWSDDARVVEYERLAKRYPNEGIDALDQPGAIIRLRPMDLPIAVSNLHYLGSRPAA